MLTGKKTMQQQVIISPLPQVSFLFLFFSQEKYYSCWNMHKLGTRLALLVIATLFNESKWRYKLNLLIWKNVHDILLSEQMKNTTEWWNFVLNVYMQREKSEMFICCFYFKFSIMIMCQSYETETIKNNSYSSKDCIWQRISPLNIKYIGTISKGGL